MLVFTNYICAMKNLKEAVAALSAMMGQLEESSRMQFNPDNLTHTQLFYLETISRLGNPNITELSAALRLTKPTVKVAVDRLIGRELVFKVRSDADRRSAHLHLTEKGRLINQMHEYAHERIAETIAATLDKEELECLLKLLSKVLSG